MRKLFVFLSIIFITFMIGFYGYRMIYYYKETHALEELGISKLSDIIYSHDYDPSMKVSEQKIYYTGNILNNYLFFSDRYYRILGVEDGKIIAVDEVSTILPFASIDEWLNNDYYNSLSNKEYLTLTSTCLDSYEENKVCENIKTSNVGLITLEEYLDIERFIMFLIRLLIIFLQ